MELFGLRAESFGTFVEVSLPFFDFDAELTLGLYNSASRSR